MILSVAIVLSDTAIVDCAVSVIVSQKSLPWNDDNHRFQKISSP